MRTAALALAACWQNPSAAPILKAPSAPRTWKSSGMNLTIGSSGMISRIYDIDNAPLTSIAWTQTDFVIIDCAGRVHSLDSETATGRIRVVGR